MSDPTNQPLDKSAISWHHPRETPPYTPNLVTLVPDQVDSHLYTISTLRTTLNNSWAIKDSFATLDLETLGFKVLFEARWLWLDPNRSLYNSASSIKWSRVRDEPDLERWEHKWRTYQDTDIPRMFPSRLINLEDVSIIAGRDDLSENSPIIAGFITCRSEGVIGISNLFGPSGREDEIRAGATKFVRDTEADSPIVDYEGVGSEELAAAERVGYEAVGPLRVWVC
ncbi:hypothetical protein ES702_00410 [subsurface metagenome]